MAKSVDLKQFRHAVSVLKEKGLIKNIDARRAQPFWVRGGKRLIDQVNKFDDVVSGKVEPIKLPQKELRAYKKAAGYETAQGFVLVPKSATEKVSIEVDKETGAKEIKVTTKAGVQHIKKAVPYHNLEQWLTDFTSDKARIGRMKKANEHFAYKIFGNTSWKTYASVSDLFYDLRNGSVSGLNILDKAREYTHKQQNEFFEHFEIVRLPNPNEWPEPKSGTRRRGAATSKAARKRWLKRTKNTAIGDRRRESARIRQQKIRDNMTAKERKAYNAKGKKRAKKSRKANKKKK